MQTDVTHYEQVRHLVDHAVKSHGRIDVIINNAGLVPFSPLERAKVEDRNSTIDVNIKGVLYGIGAALPHMKAQNSCHTIRSLRLRVIGYDLGPPCTPQPSTRCG